MDGVDRMRWRMVGGLGFSCALVLCFVCAACGQSRVSVHLALGNPSRAVDDPVGSPDNLLIVRPQYCLSYNRSNATANWVAWHLSKADLGRSDRQNDFRADDSLPAAWFHPTKAVYDNTGFDCGHLCPSSDRTHTMADNRATFLLSNMIPQAPRNNRVAWRGLEEYERQLVEAGNEAYLVAGPHGRGGRGSAGYRLRLKANGGAITVPASEWKVVLVLPERDGNDLARIDSHTRVFAALLPNVEKIDADWHAYRLSVADLEELTGLDFFTELPKPVKRALEATLDVAP